MPPSGKVEQNWSSNSWPMDLWGLPSRGLPFRPDRLGIHGEPGLWAGEKTRSLLPCHRTATLPRIANWPLGNGDFSPRRCCSDWNITKTIDFGRIVFSLARHNVMSTTPDDKMEDFRHVYEFSKAFESAYRIRTKC